MKKEYLGISLREVRGQNRRRTVGWKGGWCLGVEVDVYSVRGEFFSVCQALSPYPFHLFLLLCTKFPSSFLHPLFLRLSSAIYLSTFLSFSNSQFPALLYFSIFPHLLPLGSLFLLVLFINDIRRMI